MERSRRSIRELLMVVVVVFSCVVLAGEVLAATAPAVTRDGDAMELTVDGARALRLEPNATSPNVIGGYSGNTVTGGKVGATIGGGGSSSWINSVTDSYGTVGGGGDNTAGGQFSTVGGASGRPSRSYFRVRLSVCCLLSHCETASDLVAPHSLVSFRFHAMLPRDTL